MNVQENHNSSGQGDAAGLPEEIRGLNWGAFLLSWIWGIGNSVWIALLIFIPIFGLAMPFVLLFKGNGWAWRKRHWASVQHFKATQRKWAIAGLVIWVLLLGAAGGLWYFIQRTLTSQDYYPEALAIIRADEATVAALGAPIEPDGFVTGSISTSGATGDAAIEIPLRGSRSPGRALLLAEKDQGTWTILELVVVVEATGEHLSLIARRRGLTRGEEPI